MFNHQKPEICNYHNDWQSWGDSQGILPVESTEHGVPRGSVDGQRQGLCLIYAIKRRKELLSGGGGGQLLQSNVMIPCRANFQIWKFSDDVGGTPG